MSSPTWKSLSWLAWWVAASTGCAAKSAASPQAPVTSPAPPRASIAAKCRLPSAKESSVTNAPMVEGAWSAPRVFVEVALVKGDIQAVMASAAGRGSTPQGASRAAPPPSPPSAAAAVDFSSALSEPRLLISRVGHVMTTDGSPSKLAWDEPSPDGSAAAPPIARRDLTLTARAGGADGGDIALDIDLAPAPPLGVAEKDWVVPEHRRAHTTAVVRDQQTIVLGGFEPQASPDSRSLLVVTPYVLKGPADVRALFECKLERRAAAAK